MTSSQMFVYKHMAGTGLSTDAAGDEDEDNYDPHAHRVIAKPTSYLDTMIHMLKGSIGAGILAMPDAFRRTGIIIGFFLLAFIGFFATWTIQILINAQYRLCKRWRRGYMAYPKSMKLALNEGPKFMRWAAGFSYYFVDMVLVLWQLGICVIYFVFVATNMKQVLDYYGMVIGLRMWLVCILPPMILLNLVKDLKLMTPISSVSNGVIIIGLLLVTFYLIEDDIDLKPEMTDIIMKNIMEIPTFIGIALFALEAVGVVLALEYNMEQPKQFIGLFGLFNIGMFIIVTLYMILGIFGYLKYGSVTKASITLNLPTDQKKAQAARVIFATAIFLTFPLQNFVAYKIIWDKVKKRVPDSQQAKLRTIDYSLRVILVIVPWLLAFAIPQLGPFISLFGAFCLSLLAIVFPALLDLCVCHNESTKYGRFNHKLIRNVLIIIIGLFCLVSGCYTSIHEIIEHFN